jgi:hypothetical protein
MVVTAANADAVQPLHCDNFPSGSPAICTWQIGYVGGSYAEVSVGDNPNTNWIFTLHCEFGVNVNSGENHPSQGQVFSQLSCPPFTWVTGVSISGD